MTHEVLVVTKHGKPVAQLVPVSQDISQSENPLKNSIVFEKDIVSPIDVKWEQG